MRRQEGGGTIVNMSWDHVTTGMAGDDPQLFSAVKGGVLAFSKSLARRPRPGGARQRAEPRVDRDRASASRSIATSTARSRRPPRWGDGAARRTSRTRRSTSPRPRRRSSPARRSTSTAAYCRRRRTRGPEGGNAMAQTQEKLEKYPVDEIDAKLKEHGLDDWYYEDGWIRRKFNTDGWPTTLMLVNAVGYLCEAAWHHADLSVTWGKLWVKLCTHSSGGITDKDFALARKIEDTVLWRPGGGRPARGQPEQVRLQQGRTLDSRSLPLRNRQARGARAARDAAARGAAVRLRRRGDEDHGRGAHDAGLDRQAPRGPGGRDADHDPGPVRGRPRGARRAARGPGREGPGRPQAAARVLRAGRRPLALRRARHPRLRRDQQRSAPRPRADRRARPPTTATRAPTSSTSGSRWTATGSTRGPR